MSIAPVNTGAVNTLLATFSGRAVAPHRSAGGARESLPPAFSDDETGARTLRPGQEDEAVFSARALARSRASAGAEENKAPGHPADDANTAQTPRGADGEPLSDDEQRELEELRRRDAEVRAHEQSHLSAAGNLARGGVNLETRTGPDGKQYAVGGHVAIDSGPDPSGDPEKTIARAQRVQRAAQSPAEPSSADRAVAAAAARMEADARAELAESKREEGTESAIAIEGQEEPDDAERTSASAALDLAARFGAGAGRLASPALDLYA